MTEKIKTLYDQYKTDASAEAKEGVTLDYGPMGKITIHRAGGSNQKFKNYARAKMAPFTRQIQAGTMDE